MVENCTLFGVFFSVLQQIVFEFEALGKNFKTATIKDNINMWTIPHIFFERTVSLIMQILFDATIIFTKT